MSDTQLRNYINVCKRLDVLGITDVINAVVDKKTTTSALTSDEFNDIMGLTIRFGTDSKAKLMDIYHSYHTLVGGKKKKSKKKKNNKTRSPTKSPVRSPSRKRSRGLDISGAVNSLLSGKFNAKSFVIDNVKEKVVPVLLDELQNIIDDILDELIKSTPGNPKVTRNMMPTSDQIIAEVSARLDKFLDKMK